MNANEITRRLVEEVGLGHFSSEIAEVNCINGQLHRLWLTINVDFSKLEKSQLSAEETLADIFKPILESDAVKKRIHTKALELEECNKALHNENTRLQNKLDEIHEKALRKLIE